MVFAVRVIGLVSGLAASIVLARALGPGDFGTLAVVLTVAAMLQNVIDSGFNGILLREAVALPHEERRLAILAMRLKLVIYLPLASVVGGISWVFVLDRGHASAIILGLILCSGIVSILLTPLTLLQRRRLVWRASAAMLVQANTWSLVILLVPSVTSSLVTVALTYAFVATLNAVVVFVISFSTLEGANGPPLAVRGGFRRLPGAVRLGLAAVLIAAYVKVDGLLLYRLGSEEQAGLYAIAARFIEQAQILPMTLSMFFLARVSELSNSLRRLTNLGNFYLRTSLVFGGLGGGFLLATGPTLIAVAYGPLFTDAGMALSILCLGFPLSCAGYVVAALALNTIDSSVQLRVAGVALGVNVCLNVVFVPIWGIISASCITVLTEALVVVAFLRPLTRKTPVFLRGVTVWLVVFLTASGAAASAHGVLMRSALFALVYGLGVVVLRVWSPVDTRRLLEMSARSDQGGT